ncbi:MAG: ATP synthase F1 subunit gamma [Myxococcota bacterium]|nr:ATP synthase F1 subunit gamma [Myxococcota bacterium]
MATLSDIKRRIVSIQSTQKITSAMKMVSAAKLRRAQEAIEAARPYAQRMRETLEEVGSGEANHPLFEQREEKARVEILVITSDRGLAGAYNGQVIKATAALVKQRRSDATRVSLCIVGKKAADYFKGPRAVEVSSSRPVGPKVNYLEAKQVASGLISRFESGEVDEVVIVHNEFVSAITQSVKIVPLLPFVPPVAGEDAEDSVEGQTPYEIEPNAERLLASLVPKAVEVEIFRALLENQAGEHAARMTAMENATKNTEELIENLTLAYNRARQAAITSELVEIITGAQALE